MNLAIIRQSFYQCPYGLLLDLLDILFGNSFGLLCPSLDLILRYGIIKKGAEAVPKDSPTLPGVVRTISHSCPQFVRIRHSSGFLEVPEEVDGQRGKRAIHGQNVPLVSKNPQPVPGLTQGLGSCGRPCRFESCSGHQIGKNASAKLLGLFLYVSIEVCLGVLRVLAIIGNVIFGLSILSKYFLFPHFANARVVLPAIGMVFFPQL